MEIGLFESFLVCSVFITCVNITTLVHLCAAKRRVWEDQRGKCREQTESGSCQQQEWQVCEHYQRTNCCKWPSVMPSLFIFRPQLRRSRFGEFCLCLLSGACVCVRERERERERERACPADETKLSGLCGLKVPNLHKKPQCIAPELQICVSTDCSHESGPRGRQHNQNSEPFPHPETTMQQTFPFTPITNDNQTRHPGHTSRVTGDSEWWSVLMTTNHDSSSREAGQVRDSKLYLDSVSDGERAKGPHHWVV